MFNLPKDEGLDDGLPVTVVFRRWLERHPEDTLLETGDVIALFPFIPATVTNASEEPDCMSFMHVGQHGAAEYFHVIANTLPINVEDEADLADQTALFDELSKRGYDLEVMTHEGVCHEVGYQRGHAEGREEGQTAGLNFNK